MENTMYFDGKHTLSWYGLSLTRCTITPPRRKQRWLDIPGMDGSVELMAPAGLVSYENRTLRAEFRKTSGAAGDILDRLISDIEGRQISIVLPCGDRYMVGVAHVVAASVPGTDVVITANCQPWRYSCAQVRRKFAASPEPVELNLRNAGAAPVLPTLTAGEGGAVATVDGTEVQIAAGTSVLPELLIPGRGNLTFLLSGADVTISYREAIL